MKILDFLKMDGIICPLESDTKSGILEELVKPITKTNPNLDKTGLIRILMERENLGSTGIGGGIAIPHGKFDGLKHLVSSFGKSHKGIDFSSMDNKPAFIFFLLVAPKKSAVEHLKALARISRLLKDPMLLSGLQQAESPTRIYSLLEEYDSRLP